MATTAAQHDADAAITNVTTAANEAVARTTNATTLWRWKKKLIEVKLTTQEMVAAVAAEFEDRRRCENERDEQVLLEQLLQGNGMEENCGKQKIEKEMNRKKRDCKRKAKAEGDC